MGLPCSGGSRASTEGLRPLNSSGLVSLPVVRARARVDSTVAPVSRLFIVQDGEVPSTYFSYFWVELEDPSRYGDATATVLQIPIPEVERKRPGGIGIADLQPFLRPTPQAKEEAQEWVGLTERMVDEVDESKRKNQVYDLRLEASGKVVCLDGTVRAEFPENSPIRRTSRNPVSQLAQPTKFLRNFSSVR